MVVGRVRVDLATCLTSKAPPVPTSAVTVRGTKNSQSIVFKGKVVLTLRERYGKGTPQGIPGPIVPLGISPDRTWILYAIDPMGSASLAADGLPLHAISVNGGRSFPLPVVLAEDYRVWCGTRLVMTAGADRISTNDKWLAVSEPPDWHTRAFLRDPHVAFGSLVCDGNDVIVQSQPSSTDANFFHTHWSLYRVSFSGAMTRLTSPPAGYADESPQVAGGIVYFVRSTRGNGKLYALRNGKVVGPLLSLGYSLGYYGHHAWPYRVTR